MKECEQKLNLSEEELQDDFVRRVQAQFDRIKTYYYKEFDLHPELEPSLKKYCAVMEIKRDVRATFNEEDPIKIKEMVGTEVNGALVTVKMYENALLVDKEYNKQYDICKKILRDLSLNYGKYVREAKLNKS